MNESTHERSLTKLFPFQKRRIEKLLAGARSYMAFWCGDEGKFSREVHLPGKSDETDSGVRFSLKEPASCCRPRDNYNADTVSSFMQALSASAAAPGTDALETNIDMSFVDKMLEHIGRKRLRDSAVYKAAQIDRRLFSKIVSDRTYKPSKDTCIAFALALHLSLGEALDLLSRAGYTLSHSSKRDVIIEYFIREKVYSLDDVNEVLYRLEQKTLGR